MYEAKRTTLLENTGNTDLILLMNPTNIYYYTGFMSEPHERFFCLSIDRKKQKTTLFLPTLDEGAAQAVAEVDQLVRVADGEDGFAKLASVLDLDIKRLALEKDYMTVGTYEKLLDVFTNSEILDVTPFIEEARLHKSVDEIKKTKRAIAITEAALENVLPKIVVGMTELEVKSLLEYELKKLGAERIAFDTLVLTGKNSALPHGVSADSKIAKGDFLLFDFGVYLDEYCSDITRTFVIEEATAEQEKIYQIVKEANEAAIAAVKLGQPLQKIDLAARTVIEAAGYGDYFTHRVGHGLGLAVHEAPSIHHENRDTISPGLLFTIEPGIYVPELGGVRIEDNIYVHENGEVEVLTSYPKGLQYI